MDWSTFLHLPTSEIASIMRAAGPKVVVFPINGTRRWFMLEHPTESDWQVYMRLSWAGHIKQYQMLFDHGLDTIVTPIFGPELFRRGEEYIKLLQRGLGWFAQDQAALNFYRDYDIRVRIYGDRVRYFTGTPYEPFLKVYEEVCERTSGHKTRRLFFGVCAHDASESVAAFGAHYFQQHGTLPGREQIITAYYGEYVEPVSFFIGCDRPAVFDMPLIASGEEDLYFTVSPSLYLEPTGLRAILYDHLYGRRVNEDYSRLSPNDRQWLKKFYALNRHHVLGVGQLAFGGAIWQPTVQLSFPTED